MYEKNNDVRERQFSSIHVLRTTDVIFVNAADTRRQTKNSNHQLNVISSH